jgi:hypothetical protein
MQLTGHLLRLLRLVGLSLLLPVDLLLLLLLLLRPVGMLLRWLV